MTEEERTTAKMVLAQLSSLPDHGRELRETESEIQLSFDHVLEYYLYIWYCPSEKKVRQSAMPYASYYRMAAQEKLEMNKPRAAIKLAEEALFWNPCSLTSRLLLAEAFRQAGDLKHFRQTTRDAHRYCLTRAETARYYRNAGYYFVEKYEPKTARACYVKADSYYRTVNAQSELNYLEEALHDKTPSWSKEQIDAILQEADVFTHPDKTSLEVARHAGFELIREGAAGPAADCFEIASDIDGDTELKQLAAKLRGAI